MQLKTTNQTTPRQLQLLKAIASFQNNHCYSPTINELASEINLSRSTVFEHIEKLREKNLLSTQSSKARSLKLTSKAQKLLNYLNETDNCSNYPQSTGITLLGKVAAGLAIEAIEDKEHLSLENLFTNDDQIFSLQVEGDSMIDDGIFDGDYVICRKAASAHNGQMVIAIVDNENATLKRFYKEKAQVRLQPANENFNPIYSNNCRIEAVVVGLIRKL